MRRTRTDNRDLPHPKPVEKVELSEKHIGLRVILAVLLLFLGAGCFAYAISSLFSGSDGWCRIDSNATEYHCGEDFTFLYCLGQGDLSSTTEKKAITALYSDATALAFQQFTNDVEYEGVHNVYDINRHPNQELEVDPLLYNAFALVAEYGDRSIYLAPIYAQYDDLFYCTDDSQAVDFDPRLSEEVAASYAGIAAFAGDREAVDVELLGDNRIRLKVSQEYLDYARENGIDSFIDFFWLKNAFIADYIAEVMISNGYTRGSISSCDGFIRNLDGSGELYTLDITDRVGQVLYTAGQMAYSGPAGIVTLRDTGTEEYRYIFSNGEIRTPYLDVRDGFCKSAVSQLTCYSQEAGCGEILLQMIPVYIADSLQTEALTRLAQGGIYSVYCQDSKIRYNDPALILTSLYDGEDARYTAELVK